MSRTAPFRVVIADDLTGAADAGVKFVGRHGAVVVTLDQLTGAGLLPVAARTLVVNTESRSSGVVVARERVRAAVAAASRLAPRSWFKKVDSTLHGNVAGELGSFLAALEVPAPLALLCPAAPVHDRSVVNGRLVAPDEHDGLDVVEMVKAAGLATEAMARAATIDGVSSALARVGPTVDVVVADAGSEDDLLHLARARPPPGRTIVPVGSAGLAAAVGRGGVGTARRPLLLLPPGPAIIVLGSRNEVTAVQGRRLAAATGWPVVSVGTAQPAVEHRLPSSTAVIVTAEAGEQNGARLENLLAQLASDRMAARPGGWLVASGGATASAVLRALGAGPLELLGEASDGLPLGRTRLPGGTELTVATKAGGFGGPDALVDLVRQRDTTLDSAEPAIASDAAEPTAMQRRPERGAT